MPKYIINGGKKLSGEVTVNSSKNATAAILIASLINKGVTILKNVPQIEEINRIIEILESIGAVVTRDNRKLTVQPPEKFDLGKINIEAACKTRSIILAIGALVGRMKNFEIPQAGGCKLGSRTVKPHIFALEKFGVEIKIKKDKYDVSCKKLNNNEVVLYETGDTVTENTLLVAAQTAGKSVIKMASANYMVQDLCYFLEELGVKIKWTGAATLEVQGVEEINKDIIYEISEDPIDAMLFISTALITNSSITIKRCPIDFLELELLKLEKMGLNYEIGEKYKSENEKTNLVDIDIKDSKLTALEEKIHAMPFPGINQDNLPFFVPIATQAKGKTLIHDWAYENRAIYYSELNRLGAKITLMDPHRVEVEGPTQLVGAEMICPPALRPAAIILVAMLGAEGESILRNVYPIHRGYEKLEERLQKLGAKIRLEDEKTLC